MNEHGQACEKRIMCFHDELCQVFYAMMTALSLLREGAKVTVYFGSRRINALHKKSRQSAVPARYAGSRRNGDEAHG